MAKLQISGRELLKLIGQVGPALYPLSFDASYKRLKKSAYFDLSIYTPSITKRVTNQLERRGFVKKESTPDGMVIKISDKGKQTLLKFKLEELAPKFGRWDKKWRLVFFDVEEVDKRKRDMLRFYLLRLGAKKMQESVWISPFDIALEIKYIREILDIPHSVKLALVEQIENHEELKSWFDL